MSQAKPVFIEEAPLTAAESRKTIAEKNATIEAQRVTISELRKDVTTLRRRVNELLKNKGKSHLIDEHQLSLFGENNAEEVEIEPTPEHAKEAPDGETPDDLIRARHKPKRRARKVDYSLLERETIVHELPAEKRVCPNSGLELVPVGTKIVEELDYTPAKIKVIEHHRTEYGLAPEVAETRKAEKLLAPIPIFPLEGCMAGSGLLAQVLVQKYQFHLPLYRQEEVFQQAGLRIPRQTLCDWVLKAATLLQPIAEAIEDLIRAGPVFQLDDTVVKCQAGKGQGMRQSYLWAFVNPTVDGVAFRFTEGRGTVDLAPLLEGVIAEVLLGDGYKANKSAAREAGLDVVHAACWAHILRAFRDAYKEAPSTVRLFAKDIKDLYAIDREADEQKLDVVARTKLRKDKGLPLYARMLRRTLGWQDNFSTSGDFGKAIKYFRNSRKALRTALEDGRVPLDNNGCERAIRPVAIGRRNWLFAGSLRGGEAAATMYTIIETCKLAGVDPWSYLSDVLGRLASKKFGSIQELLPMSWEASSSK